MLATRSKIKLEDTPYLTSAVVYSVYYQLLFIRGRLPLNRNLRTRLTMMIWMLLIRLMIHAIIIIIIIIT